MSLSVFTGSVQLPDRGIYSSYKLNLYIPQMTYFEVFCISETKFGIICDMLRQKSNSEGFKGIAVIVPYPLIAACGAVHKRGTF